MTGVRIKGGSRNGQTLTGRRRVIRLWSQAGALEEYKLLKNRGALFYVFNRIVKKRKCVMPEMRPVTNLNELASELAKAEGLGKSIGVAQMSEVLGLLGERWRNMSHVEVMGEVSCIRDRAGLRSAHRGK